MVENRKLMEMIKEVEGHGDVEAMLDLDKLSKDFIHNASVKDIPEVLVLGCIYAQLETICEERGFNFEEALEKFKGTHSIKIARAEARKTIRGAFKVSEDLEKSFKEGDNISKIIKDIIEKAGEDNED